MPRVVESHLLQQRAAAAGRALLHRCGSVLVVAHATARGTWRHEVTPLTDDAATIRARDLRLTDVRRNGYRLLTHQRFTVPAADAARVHTDPAVFDQPFQQAWAHTWQPALQALADASESDAGVVTDVLLLRNYTRHTAGFPWGPPLVNALQDAPQALHAERGLLLVGVGPEVRSWLSSYYAADLEKTPAVLPGDPGDSSLTYTFALRIWQPDGTGELAALAKALVTGRDMSAGAS